MTLLQITLAALGGAVFSGCLVVCIAVIASRVEKWWAQRGGRWPWEKD